MSGEKGCSRRVSREPVMVRLKEPLMVRLKEPLMVSLKEPLMVSLSNHSGGHNGISLLDNRQAQLIPDDSQEIKRGRGFSPPLPMNC
jgi:hypothetical protein